MQETREKRLRTAASFPQPTAERYDLHLKQRPIYMATIPQLSFKDMVSLCRTSRDWQQRCANNAEIWDRWIETHPNPFRDATLVEWSEKTLLWQPQLVAMDTLDYFLRVLRASSNVDYVGSLIDILDAVLTRHGWHPNSTVRVATRLIDAGLPTGEDFANYLRRQFIGNIESPTKRQRALLTQLWRAGPRVTDLVDYEDEQLTLLQIAVLRGNKTAVRLILAQTIEEFDRSMANKSPARLSALNAALHQAIENAYEEVALPDEYSDEDDEENQVPFDEETILRHRFAMSESELDKLVARSDLATLMQKYDLRSPILERINQRASE